MLARASGRLDDAASWLRRACAIGEERAPGSIVSAAMRRELGLTALAAGELDGARSELDAALAIRRELAPDSFDAAQSWHDLARLEAAEGHLDAAITCGEHAITALEAQHGRLGGTEEVRAGFRGRHLEIYRDQADRLVAAGRLADAFDVVERSRARSLRSMLAERDLALAADLPPDLERARRLAADAYDRAQAELADLSAAAEPERLAAARARLRELRRHQDEIREQVRRLAPRLAALDQPAVLDLAAVRAALAPGTLLVSFQMVRDGVLLFAVEPSNGAPPEVKRLPIAEAALADEVRAFRSYLAAGDPSDLPVIRLRGQRLFNELLAPIAERLAAAERVVVCPDGPLRSLPFAALVWPDDGSGRYLVERLPIRLALSATLDAELRARERGHEAEAVVSVAAFGDPELDAGSTLPPLPASRTEVAGVLAAWGSAARGFLGSAASEARVKALGGGADILHFATHGLLDEVMPLDSGLALAADSTDNGLLQAWEILERPRLTNGLVVLSACRSALGVELPGEGLVGLARAFFFAGARAVVATLWEVPDRSTAALMARFHANLHAGLPADKALRRAQLALLAGPVELGLPNSPPLKVDGTHPRAWAGFTLHGEWP